jgi:hypothetical protein
MLPGLTSILCMITHVAYKCRFNNNVQLIQVLAKHTPWSTARASLHNWTSAETPQLLLVQEQPVVSPAASTAAMALPCKTTYHALHYSTRDKHICTTVQHMPAHRKKSGSSLCSKAKYDTTGWRASQHTDAGHTLPLASCTLYLA